MLVEAEKRKCDQKIERTEEAIQAHIAEREASVTQIETLDMTKSELVARKVALHSDMDEFKASYPDELKQFFLDQKHRTEMTGLLSKKATCQKQTKTLDARRKETRKEIAEVYATQQALAAQAERAEAELAASTKGGLHEIKQIEGYFD